MVVSVERRYLEFNSEYYVQGIEDEYFFRRYVDFFGGVRVLARVKKTELEPTGYKKISDRRIQFCPIYTEGVGHLKFFKVLKFISAHRELNLILRTPGFFSYIIFFSCLLSRKKFFLEVVANPLQEAAYSSRFKALNWFLTLVLPAIFRLKLSLSQGASFVTKDEIQKEYLSAESINLPKYRFHYSSINLTREFFAQGKEIEARDKAKNEVVKLLFVGVLDRPFKGLDVFINMLNNLPENFEGIVLGDGKLLPNYKFVAKNLIDEGRIRFVGYVSDQQHKIKFYRDCTVFVLCSRREGLPRVLIEAMASGMPCISSRVSGVSELLDDSFVFPVDDISQALSKLYNVLNLNLVEIGFQNRSIAKRYSLSVLEKKRIEFYKFVDRGW